MRLFYLMHLDLVADPPVAQFDFLPAHDPVELWTSPSDRLAPFGTWGQTVDNAKALTTA